MRILEVRYAKRLGDNNYGFEEVGLSADCEGDSVDVVLATLKNEVYFQLGLEGKIGGEVEEVIEAIKPVTEIVEEVLKEEPVKEEAPKEEPKKRKRRSKEEIEADKKKEEPKKEKTKRVKKDKSTKYDRENPAHKKELARILDEVAPTWRGEDKPKAKQVSADLVGEVIYDGAGDVATSFIQMITDGMA